MLSRDKYSLNKQQINQENPQLSIRRAEARDIDMLSVMSRLCYPYLLRWQGPRFHNKKRWRLVLDDGYGEVWVCSSNEQIIGYITLITDLQKFEKADQEPTPGLFVRLYVLLTCPKLFITLVLRKLLSNIQRYQRRLFVPKSGDNKIVGSETITSLEERKVPWVGYVAVTPAMQGKGVATEMVRFCVQRARELGYREIWVKVEKKNIGAMKAIKKAGFVVTEKVNQIIYSKQSLEID